VLEMVRPGMEDPNLQKNRKIQGSDQPARAAPKARSRKNAPGEREGLFESWEWNDEWSGRYRVSRMRCSASGAKRCVADPGPPRTETVPGLQRTTSCCAAPGTRERRAFWRNEAKCHFAIRSSPRKRGPIITAGGYGSRLSARFRGRRPGRQELAPRGAATCGCTKSKPGQFSLFRIDINNENCNSNVSGQAHVTPHMSPAMWHHAS
jgi:hypothetical protein